MLKRANALRTLIHQRHPTPSCGGHVPTAERTLGPARIFTESLTPGPELENSLGQQYALGPTRLNGSIAPISAVRQLTPGTAGVRPESGRLREPRRNRCGRRPTVIRDAALIVLAENNVVARSIQGIIALEHGPKRFASEPNT